MILLALLRGNEESFLARNALEELKRKESLSQKPSQKAFRTIDGLCADGREKCTFKIPNSLLLRMHKLGWKALFNWKNLPYGLNHPVAIFKGLERDSHEESYCYVS